MILNKKRNWLFGLIATGCCMCSSVSAELVYEDNFDRQLTDADGNTVTTEEIRINSTGDWFKINRNLNQNRTIANAGEGVMTIHTEDIESGVLSPISTEMNFFDRELTFTFDGINIQTLGPSRVQSQWLKFGIVAYSKNRFWKGKSFFTVSYSGAGQFLFQVQQAGVDGFDNAPRKDFRSSSFNFDVSKLRAVEMTLDSVNYRVKFTFENDLDILSFSGPHNLDANLWVAENGELAQLKQRVSYTERTLAFYQEQLASAQAASPIIQADVDVAQAGVLDFEVQYSEAVDAYDAAIIASGGLGGDSGLIMVVSSDAQAVINRMTPAEYAAFNIDRANGVAEIGARATINNVRVETSNIFQGL